MKERRRGERLKTKGPEGRPSCPISLIIFTTNAEKGREKGNIEGASLKKGTNPRRAAEQGKLKKKGLFL